MSSVKEEQERYRERLGRLYGSMPWLKSRDRKRFVAKVFKSGNSLALRLPAGVGLSAGMEMDLSLEGDMQFSFEPIEAPKRKFDIEKVWGSATDIDLIKPEDRIFEESRLPWDAGEDT